MPEKDKQNNFDIDFKLLPPELQLKLWILALDADTSQVNVAYKNGAFATSFSYSYDGALGAAMSVRRFKSKFGVNPSDGKVNMGLAFRGFNFGASTNLTKPTLGLNLAYGLSLLPFPQEMGSTFTAAAGGLKNTFGNLGSLPDNPLDWYGLHSDDFDSISKAVKLGQSIAKTGESKQTFGVGLRLNYAPDTGLTIYGGALFKF